MCFENPDNDGELSWILYVVKNINVERKIQWGEKEGKKHYLVNNITKRGNYLLAS
jgi:hypothetical protein